MALSSFETFSRTFADYPVLQKELSLLDKPATLGEYDSILKQLFKSDHYKQTARLRRERLHRQAGQLHLQANARPAQAIDHVPHHPTLQTAAPRLAHTSDLNTAGVHPRHQLRRSVIDVIVERTESAAIALPAQSQRSDAAVRDGESGMSAIAGRRRRSGMGKARKARDWTSLTNWM